MLSNLAGSLKGYKVYAAMLLTMITAIVAWLTGDLSGEQTVGAITTAATGAGVRKAVAVRQEKKEFERAFLDGDDPPNSGSLTRRMLVVLIPLCLCGMALALSSCEMMQKPATSMSLSYAPDGKEAVALDTTGLTRQQVLIQAAFKTGLWWLSSNAPKGLKVERTGK